MTEKNLTAGSLTTGARSVADDRSRWAQVANSLILHLHPVSVPAASLRFWYTWGLGGMSTVLVVLLALTGLLLMFRYDARVDYAYLSIQELETQVIFGSLVRATHHWSANLLVVTTFLHLLRVFFTASYKQGRGWNWVVGLGLFALVLAANFTGFLLPWDQLSYWAITVSTSLLAYIPLVGVEIRNFFLGGPEVGQAALSNFYALHVVFIPYLLAMITAYHFWKVRKNGGITQPGVRDGEKPMRLSTIPNLVNLEYAAAIVLILFVSLWAMTNPAPLEDLANPVSSPNPAKAAWYFLGLQEMLLHMHPLAALGLVGILGGGLLLLPLFDRKDGDVGIYFRSVVGKRTLALGALLALALTPLMVVLDEYWLDLPAWLPDWPGSITSGLMPFISIILLIGIIYSLPRWLFNRQDRANHSEAVLGVFAFVVMALVVLTVIGVYFRGQNMALVLPF